MIDYSVIIIEYSLEKKNHTNDGNDSNSNNNKKGQSLILNSRPLDTFLPTGLTFNVGEGLERNFLRCWSERRKVEPRRRFSLHTQEYLFMWLLDASTSAALFVNIAAAGTLNWNFWNFCCVVKLWCVPERELLSYTACLVWEEMSW